ncbi:hypothetical protein CRG98_026410 [Punica granatum]|uniref:MULE transposase domain-containing protein n=1 Tax=Punica granatum TaxID=22663 RepID=A0A2I0JAC6_PUNGR|nr:hypothetical protein CRG98_026410 [Punica granatum]
MEMESICEVRRWKVRTLQTFGRIGSDIANVWAIWSFRPKTGEVPDGLPLTAEFAVPCCKPPTPLPCEFLLAPIATDWSFSSPPSSPKCDETLCFKFWTKLEIRSSFLLQLIVSSVSSKSCARRSVQFVFANVELISAHLELEILREECFYIVEKVLIMFRSSYLGGEFLAMKEEKGNNPEKIRETQWVQLLICIAHGFQWDSEYIFNEDADGHLDEEDEHIGDGSDPENGEHIVVRLSPTTADMVIFSDEDEGYISEELVDKCISDDEKSEGEFRKYPEFDENATFGEGLKLALEELCPGAPHRNCVLHIWRNFYSKYKNMKLTKQLWKCTRSTTMVEFDQNMMIIKRMNEDAWAWLKRFKPDAWNKVGFSDYPKNDNLLNNTYEQFNSKIVKFRGSTPIRSLRPLRPHCRVSRLYHPQV